MLRRLNIGPRLTLSFALIILLMFLGSAVSFWQFTAMRSQAQHLHNVDKTVESLLQVHNDILILKSELSRLVEAKDGSGLTARTTELGSQARKSLRDAINALEASPLRDADYAVYLASLQEIRDTLPIWLERIVAAGQAGNWQQAEFLLASPVSEDSQNIQVLVDQIMEAIALEQEQARMGMKRAEFLSWFILGLTTVISGGVAIRLSMSVTRSIAQAVSRLDAGAKALAQGDFSYRIFLEGEDELSNLGQMFNNAAIQMNQLYTDLEGVVQDRTTELRRRAMQLETSFAVGQRIISILDLNNLLNQVSELIKTGYGYYYVGIFLLEENGQYITAQAGTGEAGRTLHQTHFRMHVENSNLIGQVVKEKQAAWIDDVSEDSRYLFLNVVPDTRSELALPLRMGNKMLGVLDIRSKHTAAFLEDDIPALQSLANQVTIAIQNASLYQREQSRRRLAEILYEAGRSISHTLDMEEVLNLILAHLATIVSYDRAAVMLKRETVLEFAAARGFPADIEPRQLEVFIKEGDVFAEISETQQPLSIPDVSKRPDWHQVPQLPQARSWLGVPLIRFDAVIGMFSLTREALNAYTDDEVTLVAAFAGQAAISLENARLYDEITRFSQHLEELVEERTEELQSAYEQLEHLNRTKSDFINIASHELRTPITVLQGYSKMLLGDEKIKENAFHLQLISGIHSGAIRLHEIVNSMLDVAKIDSRALELYPEPLTMASVIQDLYEKLENSLAERNLEFIIEDLSQLPAIEADPDALHKMFSHLVVNAIKYTPDGGRITISGQANTDKLPHPNLEIVVSDTGIGIDPDFHDLVFTKFYQTGELALHSTGKTKFKGAGPGLGLAIVRGIAEAHQGKVWVESEGHDEEARPGSHFHVVLPLRQETDD